MGPWFLDSKAVKDKQFSSSFQLREDGNSVEIEEPGIYFIYAQVSTNRILLKLHLFTFIQAIKTRKEK